MLGNQLGTLPDVLVLYTINGLGYAQTIDIVGVGDIQAGVRLNFLIICLFKIKHSLI